MSDVLWFNGRFTTTEERVLRVEDRGFQFGDGVYEVFKFLGKGPIFLSEHFRRMERGLRAIDIPNPWDEPAFAATIGELLERTAFDEGIVYIQVTRGESERAHFYPDNMTPTAVAYTRRFRFPDPARKERGIRVSCLCPMGVRTASTITASRSAILPPRLCARRARPADTSDPAARRLARR